MLSIYNTLTRKKEEFIPLEAGKVKMYVCGPTVYDLFHIGNARSFINSDFIRKYLEYLGYEVKFVMNLTDIDDKIIRKGLKENTSAQQVAETYTNEFFKDITTLGIKPATIYPRATEHIEDIIALIQSLVDNGTAYQSGNDVFYDISKFSTYGKLSGKNIDDLIEGARVEVNEAKKSPLDFALWKGAKEGEPFWESPWGKGRPGWHIECSAMSCKHLGKTFDIHAGGSDLIFPHHENEIAQSEASTGQKFVNYWLHFGFLNIDNEKMSKSLGNFFTARDILAKYSKETVRFFFAQTHYAAPLNFTSDGLDSSKRGLQKVQNLYERLLALQQTAVSGGNQPDFNLAGYYQTVEESLNDDFNSPKALAVVFDFVRDANRVLNETENPAKEFVNEIMSFVQKIVIGIFGIIHLDKSNAADPTLENELIELLISLRTQAKTAKNFQMSDFIRDELKKLGIVLQDSKEKTTYKKQE